MEEDFQWTDGNDLVSDQPSVLPDNTDDEMSSKIQTLCIIRTVWGRGLIRHDRWQLEQLR